MNIVSAAYRLLFLILILILSSFAVASPVKNSSRKVVIPSRKEVATHREANPALDETVTTTLVIKVENSTVQLFWQPLTGNWEFVVLRASRPDLSNIDTVAITQDTTWTESINYVNDSLMSFYQVIPRLHYVPGTAFVIEDFDPSPVLTSYSSSQDQDPSEFRWATDGTTNPGGLSLELYGNTWKKETLDTTYRLNSNSVWQVAMKSMPRGENQGFGIADSANEMWYEIWGTETFQSEAWIPTYTGWFAQNAWMTIDLPVGSDWFGRFGYYPKIDKLYFANDNDGSSSQGIVRFDEIHDVSGIESLPPVADFNWSISDYPTPDSMEVHFTSMSYDPDGFLQSHLWILGDGTSSREANPVHRYPSGSAYVVTLTVTDSTHRSAFILKQVQDTAFTATREFTTLFTGDIMLARNYAASGGIIPTQGVNAIFAPTQPLISSVDFAMCNLESPLTNATVHHPTKSIYFKGKPEYISGITWAGFDFCALANNHVFDYLQSGMDETIHVLDSVGLLATGAGDDDIIARQPVFFTKNGLSVAILSFCNRDGSYDNYQPFLDAGRSKPGFANWNRSAIEQTIPQAKDLADLVIVQVHSGNEYSDVPPRKIGNTIEDPEFLELSLLPDTGDIALRHYAIDMGADLIINHHPHVMQGNEVYHGKLIAHSMGNFAFDQTYIETFTSMAVTARLKPDQITDYVVHPVYIDRYIPHFITGEAGAGICNYQTELARANHTWIVRAPNTATASIILDTTVTRTGVNHTDTLTLEDRNGYAYSAPYKLPDGYPVQITPQSPANLEFRVGHEILWFGNMENEGANLWDLNSNYERFDSLISSRGQRSIGLNRAGAGTNSVSTNLLYRPELNMSYEHSAIGWVRGDNALNAQMQFEAWNARSGGTMNSSTVIGSILQGTFDWQKIWQNLTIPGSTYYYNIKLYLQAPTLEGKVWFDDLAVIRWEAWQSGPASLPFPGDLSYIQLRTTSGTEQASFTYRLEWIETP